MKTHTNPENIPEGREKTQREAGSTKFWNYIFLHLAHNTLKVPVVRNKLFGGRLVQKIPPRTPDPARLGVPTHQTQGLVADPVENP